MCIKKLILFLAFPIFVICDEVPQYECEVVGNDTCYLSNVETTWDNPKFKANSARPWDIIVVEIKSGKIPLLTDSLCSAFSSVTSLTVSHLSIEKIDDYLLGALNRCNNLELLDLSHNNITKVNGELFKGNWALKHLNLAGNPLTEFPANFFGSIKKIKEINLIGTQIPYFPFDDTTRELKGIETIRLSHTPLLDLEIEKLILHLPSLKSIHLRDTNILCSRMDEIRNVAASYGIELEATLTNEKRQRNYDLTFSGEFECLNKDQWNLEAMKRSVSDLLSETKFSTLLELTKKNELKTVILDEKIKVINKNIDQYYIDATYVSSYISFIGTTLVILLAIVSITSVCMCWKVRRYIEEERFRNTMQQQQNMMIDNKRTLYF